MRIRQARWTKLVGPLVLGFLLASIPARAQLSQNMQDWLRLINSPEFAGSGARGGRGGPGGPGRWVEGGQAYMAIERGAAGGSEIARYDTATGKREVLMSAAQLTPPQLGTPLRFTDFSSSANGKRMLFATNPRGTMIRKTAFDYWALDKTANTWRKLGGNSTSALLHAKLSPDGSRAAYLRDRNLYVEDINSGAVTQLTSDGTDMIINGTSDWVYEEEFYLRDGFRWSPDGQKIAYFQFDQTGVPEFALINYTDSLYPVITSTRTAVMVSAGHTWRPCGTDS